MFDDEAVNLCVECCVDFLKLATREYHNLHLLQKCQLTQLPIVRSFRPDELRYLHSQSENILDMTCVPEYPTLTPHIPETLQWLGWSSHTQDWKDVLIAVSRGACVIEKHIKFRHDDYEAGWSLWPRDFGQMIEDVREVEEMIE